MINPFYLSDSFLQPFSTSFRSRQNAIFPETGASVDSSVFPVAVWPDFLEGGRCEALKSELAGMTFTHRSSDLYEFHQTVDLKHVSLSSHPLIAQLCRELYSQQFVGAMERITGRALGPHVDISGQRYQQGDFLLCHDDRLEKRRIALILYLIGKEDVLQGGTFCRASSGFVINQLVRGGEHGAISGPQLRCLVKKAAPVFLGAGLR